MSTVIDASTTLATAPLAQTHVPTLAYADVRAALLARKEIALVDVREEDPYAQAHPLWAANLPLSRLELEAWSRIPRRDTLIVLYGEHDGADLAPQDLAPLAAAKLAELGYTRVYLLEGGLAGWRAAGGELFQDVNVPSKAFGEVVEGQRHTPSFTAQEVKALIDAQRDVVIVDARRYDEFQTMSIPTATSVPGAELVLRIRELAPDPATQVIVNCAGRTRSIIGTQSLVNAGIPNPVAALRNGTIGWLLADQVLDHGASRRHPEAVCAQTRAQADARAVAARANVPRIALADLAKLEAPDRTLYKLDVRTPEEYAAGHLPGFASAPGGQLVQETDHTAAVRGARIVLADDDGVRADMTASWLAQMGWEVYVVDPVDARERNVTGSWQAPVAASPTVRTVEARALAGWLDAGDTAVIDVTRSANYAARHIPGAWFAVSSDLPAVLKRIPPARRYVLTCGSSQLARFAAADLAKLTQAEVWVLDGGTAAWEAAGLPVESGETRLASDRIDRYRRPYEGTSAPRAAMQGYLDWEFGLVEQLARDSTHGFRVI
jgi:rhodanese-related sulfurtransferase